MEQSTIDGSKIIGSYLGGFIVVCIFYILQKNKSGRTTSVSFQEVVGDFWFNHFLTRRVASFIYFISLTFFVGTCFLGVVVEGEGSQSILWIGLSLLSVLITRIGLEMIIAVIKIAENTSAIVKNNHQ